MRDMSSSTALNWMAALQTSSFLRIPSYGRAQRVDLNTNIAISVTLMSAQKRPRSDDDSPISADEEANTSSDSSDTDAVDLTDYADDALKTPLHEALKAMLWHLLPGETVSACMQRLSASAQRAAAQKQDASSESVKSPLDECIDAAHVCAVQHGLLTSDMTREAVLAVCRRRMPATATLPRMWCLKWIDDPIQKVHGPFPTQRLASWCANGYFNKKKAVVLDVNNPRAVHSDALQWEDAVQADFNETVN